MRRTIAFLLLSVALVACGSAPNLDQELPGMAEPAVRAAVAGHLDWGEKLSEAELDDVVSFLVTFAGTTAMPPGGDPGLVVWRANDCARCHALAAGEESSGS